MSDTPLTAKLFYLNDKEGDSRFDCMETWTVGMLGVALQFAEAYHGAAQTAAPPTSWIPISKAPKTGEHILATHLGAGDFGTCGGKEQDASAVVHWWNEPGEEGWYLSLGNCDDRQDWPTHFQYIGAAAPSDRERRLEEALQRLLFDYEIEARNVDAALVAKAEAALRQGGKP